MFSAKVTGATFTGTVAAMFGGEYGFLWSDYPFGFISETWGYVLRYTCIVIAAVTGGLTLSCVRYSMDKYQSARFVGIGLFCFAFVYGTMSRMGGPVTPRLPLYLLALLVTLYGYRGWLRQNIRPDGGMKRDDQESRAARG